MQCATKRNECTHFRNNSQFEETECGAFIFTNEDDKSRLRNRLGETNLSHLKKIPTESTQTFSRTKFNSEHNFGKGNLDGSVFKLTSHLSVVLRACK